MPHVRCDTFGLGLDSLLTRSEQEAVDRLKKVVAELCVKVPPNGLPEGWTIKGDNEDNHIGDPEYPFTLLLNGTVMATGREYPDDGYEKWTIDCIAAAETAPVVNAIMEAWRIYHRDLILQNRLDCERAIEEDKSEARRQAIKALNDWKPQE